MNFKLAWILLAVLLLAIGGLLVSTLLDDGPALGEILLQPLAGAKEDEIDGVEIVRAEPGEEKIVFARSGKNRWEIVEPGRSKADAFAVKKIITDLLMLKPVPSPEVSSSKSAHGLDKPGLRVTLKSGTKSATLNIGDTTIGRNPVTFATTGDRPNVPVAVLRSDIDGLFRPDAGADGPAGKSWQKAKWIGDYRQKAFFLGSQDLGTETESITIAKADKSSKIVRNPATGDWTFASPAGFGLADTAGDPQAPPAAFTGVRPLVSALTALQVLAPDDFLEKPESLDKYGLAAGDKDAIRIEVKPKDGPAEALLVGKRVDDKSDKFYCKLASDSIVAKATATPERIAAFAKVATDPSDLRDRTLIPDAKQFSVDAIDIAIGAATTKLRRLPTAVDSRWTLYGGPNDPQYAGVAVQDVLAALAKPRVAKDVLAAPHDAAFTGAEKPVEIKLWYDGLEKGAPVDPEKLPPEPKLNGAPSLTLLFGKTEGDAVLVRRTTADGIRTDMKLPSSVVAIVRKDRLAFLDPKLKPFPINTVKSFSLARGPQVYTIASDGKAHADQWKFTAPESLKGQTADAGKVGELLNLAAIMVPTKIVSENAGDADLAKYGVGDKARTKLTVTFDTDKQPPLAFEFGGETEDKSLVHLRTDAKPVIRAVPKAIADRFLTEDLRDRLVCTIDLKKIKAVSLIGWKQALKKPTKYRFERAGDSWKLTEPAEEKRSVDPARMEVLLAALAAPRAAALHAGGFKPEMGFDLQAGDNNLEVHMEMDDKSVVSWHFAKETDGGANYYGWTSARKDDVFTISTAVLRAFREKPESLLK
jgi:Domain of unknown function (DUF4340)